MFLTILLAFWFGLPWGEDGRIDPGWKEVRYKGHTAYALLPDSSGVCLRAESHGQHSALFHAVPRDLHLLRVRWRWRVLNHPKGADPAVRELDDRAAAVFIVVHRSILPWRTKGLLYQWAPIGSGRKWSASPYATDIKVLTLEQAPAGGAWVSEERDLDRDLREAFGELSSRIEAIGVLCDADNTRDLAVAEFGELQLEAEPRSARNP